MTAILLSFLLLLQGVPVQQGGRVTGTLRDNSGMPLPGVRIAAVARGGTVEESLAGTSMAGLAQTDEQGRFTLEDIPQGRYSIAAGRLDLQTYYPGTQSLADSTIFTIAPGETISGISFVLNNTSLGRAASSLDPAPRITASIPVRVVVDKGGKLPVSANNQLISLRLEFGTNSLMIPIDGLAFNVPGPVATDFRISFENLPDTYEVKSISYGSTAIPQGFFKLAAANFPTLSTSTPVPAASTISPTATNTFTLILVSSSTVLKPAVTPPSTLSIIIAEKPQASRSGARVSGRTGTKDKRRVFISGNPGMTFSDGTFEFRDVKPGRHLIASLGGSSPFASVVVVGDQDLNGIELKEAFLLPDDVRHPKAPMPAGDLAPGTVVPLSRIVGTVVEEQSKAPIAEGEVIIKSGDYSRNVAIDDKGHFETFTLLPGTYDLRFQIFGHSSTGPTVVVGDKDLTLEVHSLRLY